jgi:hypothetical protein
MSRDFVLISVIFVALAGCPRARTVPAKYFPVPGGPGGVIHEPRIIPYGRIVNVEEGAEFLKALKACGWPERAPQPGDDFVEFSEQDEPYVIKVLEVYQKEPPPFAIRLLKSIGTPRSLDALELVLANPRVDLALKAWVAEAIGRIGTLRALRLLIDVLAAPEVDSRYYTLEGDAEGEDLRNALLGVNRIAGKEFKRPRDAVSWAKEERLLLPRGPLK